jgi:hypothetical protein
VKQNDQGFVLALLGVALVSFLVVHVRASAPAVCAHAPTCESCHANIDQGVHPAIGKHAFDKHDVHRVLASCVDCHASEVHAQMAHGEAIGRRCVLCHAPSVVAALHEGQEAWEHASCGACHRDFSMGQVQFGPPLDHLADKLTREWTYRYLLEPAAFDATAPPGTHGIAGDDDALSTQAKAMAITTFLLDGVRTRRSETWKVPAATRDPARFQALMQGCRGCHALTAQGTKTNAAWLADFLHKHTKGGDAEVTQLALGLAVQYHPTFEGRWPTIGRALDTELRTQAEAHHIPDSTAMDQWLRPLGAALYAQEGCAHCHKRSNTTPSPSIPLTRPLAHFDRTHRPLRNDSALQHYVEALLLWEQSRRVELSE